MAGVNKLNYSSTEPLFFKAFTTRVHFVKPESVADFGLTTLYPSVKFRFMMKIALTQLRDTEQREFHFSGSQEKLGLETLEFPVQNTEVTALFSESDHGYYLHGDVTTHATLVCDRCLSEFGYDIETPLAALIVMDDSDEFEDEEVIEVPASSLHIDITKFVRDTIALALPFKILCKEECQGLCAQCGTNLNESSCDCDTSSIDPRWNKLKELNLED